MPIQIKDDGRNNQIEIDPTVSSGAEENVITIRGSDNQITIGKHTHLAGVAIDIVGSGCSLTIGQDCGLKGGYLFRTDKGHVSIGDRTMTMMFLLSLHEPGRIVIGEDSLIAAKVRLDVSDMHSIIDAQSGVRLNPPRDIVVERHVWIGDDVFVTKGVRIGHDSIIGAKALVGSDIPPNSLAVGVPARVIRANVSWRRELLPVEDNNRQRPAVSATTLLDN